VEIPFFIVDPRFDVPGEAEVNAERKNIAFAPLPNIEYIAQENALYWQ